MQKLMIKIEALADPKGCKSKPNISEENSANDSQVLVSLKDFKATSSNARPSKLQIL